MSDDSASRSPLVLFAIAAAVCGLAMIVVGGLWQTLAPESVVWSPEQANQLAAADAARHAAQSGVGSHAGHSHGGDHAHAGAAGEEPAHVAEAERKFKQLSDELESARHLRDVVGLRLIQVGFGLTAAGGFGYLTAQRNA